ncbi:unnamed protein product [Xylocopa violacea]|uniref:Uncharacterized protein n=1 Tax=Xylocopa violacea TaxID=135666 RepID=A0ABP1NHC3_XYLVO
MDPLLLFLLTSTVLVQGYEKDNDPNDEPFLPIYPVYPYSPKLIKRGVADRESAAQSSPELHAPKVGAKDSYGASVSASYPREPYPNYDPHPKVSSSPNYGYYGSIPYSYPAASYNAYPSYPAPYTVSAPPYGAISYPNYYYQSTYYYPNSYYSKPLFYTPPPPPPPPPPAPANDYPSNSQSEPEVSDKNKEKYPSAEQNRGPVQFVDGANYISDSSKDADNSRDLDSQSSSYKTSARQNQLLQWNDIEITNLPIPKTSYRVISVAGQPVGPDYPLPAPYAKAQQLEELMSRAWGKAFVQNLRQASEDRYPAQEANKNVVARMNSGQYPSQNDHKKDARFVAGIAKSGPNYAANPNLPGKTNAGQATGQAFQTSPIDLSGVKAYPVPMKAGVYYPSGNPVGGQTEANAYENFENASSQGSQSYDGPFSPQVDDKQQQNYENDSGQTYQRQSFVTAQMPREFNYLNNVFSAPQAVAQQRSKLYEDNLDDVNFGGESKKG